MDIMEVDMNTNGLDIKWPFVMRDILVLVVDITAVNDFINTLY